jgi:D-alanyl-D-alanine carboxypeptidase/D-alanyl-D-alanine-endopeptidase (penicillin-binding protein 4)
MNLLHYQKFFCVLCLFQINCLFPKQLFHFSRPVDVSFALEINLADAQTALIVQNPSQPLIPASLSKLFMALAVLEEWPESHRFTTEIHLFGSIKNGVVKGPGLGFLGRWDPSLRKEHLFPLILYLKSKEVRVIEGDLFLFEPVFPLARPHEKHQKVMTDSSQGVRFSPSGMDFGTLEVFMKTGAQGKTDFSTLLPHFPLVLNKLDRKTCLLRKLPNYYFAILEDAKHPIGRLETCRRFTRQREMAFYRPVISPAQYTGEVLKSLLLTSGIEIKGQIKILREEKEWPVIVDVLKLHGERLGQIVWEMLRYSNNYLADGLAIKWWFEKKKKNPQTLDEVGSFLSEEMLLGNEGEKLLSPSGLDRRNRLSAESILAVLRTIKNEGVWYPLILNALPSPKLGIGTLSKRDKLLLQLKSQDIFRAKTGTLSDPASVVALGGYVRFEGREGQFALVVNSNKLPLELLRHEVDQQIITVLKKSFQDLPKKTSN